MSEKLGNIVAENIHILHIETVKQKIDVGNFKKAKHHQIAMGTRFAFNLEDSRCKIELYLRIDGHNDDAPVSFHINFHFRVVDMDHFYAINVDKKAPVFQSHFISTLIGISLSTARGMIYEKLNNSGLKNIILPVVAPQNLLTKSAKQQKS
jgi:hypothetical protein